MVYLIAALVACLAVIAWQRSSLRTARARGEAIAANAASERVTARQRAETDARLLADAWALMRDDRRRGKLDNHKAWIAAHGEWEKRAVGKVAWADRPREEPV